MGGYFPWNNANPTYTYPDQIDQDLGVAQCVHRRLLSSPPRRTKRTAPYSGYPEFQQHSPVTTGNAWADLLVGHIANYSQVNQQLKYYNRYKVVEPYFQDDWHVSKKLTLNLGLRMSMFGTYTKSITRSTTSIPALTIPRRRPQIDVTGIVTGQAGAIIPGTGNPYDGLVQCGTNGVPAAASRGTSSIRRRAWVSPSTHSAMARHRFAADTGSSMSTPMATKATPSRSKAARPLVLNSTQYNIAGYTNIGGGGCNLPPGVRRFRHRPSGPTCSNGISMCSTRS